MSSLPFRAPSWTKRCSPPPNVDRPNYNPKKVSPRPSVALRGQKEVKVFSPPFPRPSPPFPRPSPALPRPSPPFFAPLRAPSRTKRFSPPPFADRPNYALANLSSDNRPIQTTPKSHPIQRQIGCKSDTDRYENSPSLCIHSLTLRNYSVIFTVRPFQNASRTVA